MTILIGILIGVTVPCVVNGTLIYLYKRRLHRELEHRELEQEKAEWKRRWSNYCDYMKRQP